MLNKLEYLDIECIADSGTEFFADISNELNGLSSINFRNLKK